MSPKQKKLAAKAPPPNKLDGKDFAVLRAEKAKNRGMGLQDEKVQPGKVMKAKRGKSIMTEKVKSNNFAGYTKAFEGPQHKGRVSTISGVKPTLRGGRSKTARTAITASSLKKNLMKTKNPYSDLVKTTAKGPENFMKRRAIAAKALNLGKKTRIGKIALGVAAAGIGAKKYLESKMKKKDEPKKKMVGGMASPKQVRGRQITRQKKQVDPSQSPSEKLKIYLFDKDKFKNKPQIDVSNASKKMGGGMMKKYSKGSEKKLMTSKERAEYVKKAKVSLGATAESLMDKNQPKKRDRLFSKHKKMGGGMMQRPMGYDIGGGVSKAKEHKKNIKDKAGTVLGYAGEMAKTLSKATPVGATKNAASIILAKVKEKKEAKTRRGKIIERLRDAPKRFPKLKPDLRGKPRPLPLDPGPRTRPKRMPGNPNKPPKYMPLRSGGMMGYKSGTSVKVKCKLGRNKPTKMY